MAIKNVKEITGKNFVTQKGKVISSVFNDAVEEYLKVVETGDYEKVKSYCITQSVAVKTAKNIVKLANAINGSATYDLSILPSDLYKIIEERGSAILFLTQPIPVAGSAKYDTYVENMDWFRVLVTKHISSSFGVPNRYRSAEENTKDLLLAGASYNKEEADKTRKQIVFSNATYNTVGAFAAGSAPFLAMSSMNGSYAVFTTITGLVIGGMSGLLAVTATISESTVIHNEKKGKMKKIIPLPLIGEKTVNGYVENFHQHIDAITGSMKSYLLQFRN